MIFTSSANPFVGLRPFESDESLLFFGRQKQIMELLERLHRNQFVAVTGSSGCGKSSLIRAGLIPKLKAGYLVDDRDEWVIAVMKPGESPMLNLTASLLEQLSGAGMAKGVDFVDLQKRIRDQGAEAVLEALQPLWDKGFSFFLLVDQFEELFPDVGQVKVEAKDEDIDFVNILLELSAQKELPIYVVITMRSDYIGDCAQYYGLPEALNEGQYTVPRLNRMQLKSAIEGPVRLFEGRIHPGLTERLLNDAQNMKVELPLLQHVLMRIWEREKTLHQNGALDLEDYQQIGGIEKALSNHAEEALRELSDERRKLAKKIFQSLTRIDEKGRKTRRKVRLRELEAVTGASREEILFVIARFNDDSRSFIILSGIKNTDDVLVDISHESLIAQWGTLNEWVDEEAESAKIFLRLAEAAGLYEKGEKDLLSGNELHTIFQWYNSFKPDGSWARRYKEDLDRGVRYLQQSEKEERRQLFRKRLNRRLFFAGVVFVALLISAFAIVLFVNSIKRKRALALSYWNNSYATRAEGNYTDALHLIAEAVVLTGDEKVKRDLLIDAESFLPHTCLMDIFEQPDVIISAVLSRDNTRILTASNDGNVYILDRKSGQPAGRRLELRGPVMSAVYSNDEKWILTASNDRSGCIWDAATGQKIRSFAHGASVNSAVFSPTEKEVLTACADGSAYLWDVATGKVIASLRRADVVTCAVFSPDGKEIVAGCVNGDVVVWDAEKKEILRTFHQEGRITSVVFSWTGKEILTAGSDSCAYVRDIVTGNKLFSLRHPDGVTSAVFSPDGKWILTADRSKMAYLWDASTGELSGAPMKGEGPIYCANFSPDGMWILTGGWDKAIRVWRLANAVRSGESKSFRIQGKINSARYSPDGRKVILAGDDRYIHIWDIGSGKESDSLIGKAEVEKAVLSPDGKQVLTGSDDGYVRIWDKATMSGGKCIDSIPYPDNIYSVMMSGDGKKILIAGGDSAARLFDVRSHKELAMYKHENVVKDAVFSPDGRWILTASWDRTARLWDVVTGYQIGPSMRHAGFVNSAVFSPDGQWILTTDFGRSSHLWSTSTKKEIGLGIRHAGPVFDGVFSPDGRGFLTMGISTADISEMEGDLDMPADLFKLQAKAVTGVEYITENTETRCINAKNWYLLKDQYAREAGRHSAVCKFLRYNYFVRLNR